MPQQVASFPAGECCCEGLGLLTSTWDAVIYPCVSWASEEDLVGCKACERQNTSIFEREKIPHWPLKEQQSSLWLQPALDYLRCLIVVGSMMSWAENSACCYQSKSWISCNLFLGCRPFQPSPREPASTSPAPSWLFFQLHYTTRVCLVLQIGHEQCQ